MFRIFAIALFISSFVSAEVSFIGKSDGLYIEGGLSDFLVQDEYQAQEYFRENLDFIDLSSFLPYLGASILVRTLAQEAFKLNNDFLNKAHAIENADDLAYQAILLSQKLQSLNKKATFEASYSETCPLLKQIVSAQFPFNVPRERDLRDFVNKIFIDRIFRYSSSTALRSELSFPSAPIPILRISIPVEEFLKKAPRPLVEKYVASCFKAMVLTPELKPTIERQLSLKLQEIKGQFENCESFCELGRLCHNFDSTDAFEHIKLMPEAQRFLQLIENNVGPRYTEKLIQLLKVQVKLFFDNCATTA